MSQGSLSRISPRVLDQFEKYVLCAIFGFFAWRMISNYIDTGATAILIYLFDQFVIIAFLLLRRPTDSISVRADDWLLGFAGTFIPLMQGTPSGAPLFSASVIVSFMLVGVVIHVAAKLTLRRSFGVVAANRGVKTNGAYSIVRHPMYLGYIISQLGFLMSGPTLWNTGVFLTAVALFVARIECEERILRQDADYAGAAGHKLVPGVY